ncbi:hypothetical protein [Schleiferilactobacillus perolens]|nr:hypothetical protein [Schleiferilactobacillus perolens]
MKSVFMQFRARLVECIIMTLVFAVCWQLFRWPAFHYAFYISLFLCIFLLIIMAGTFWFAYRR